MLESLTASSLAGQSSILRIRVVYVVRDTQSGEARYFVSLLEDLVQNANQTTLLDIEVCIYDTAASLLSASSTMDSLANWDNPFLDPTEKKPTFREASKGSVVVHRAGRPNLTTVLNHLLNDTMPESRGRARELGGGVALAACGPLALIESARRAARDCDQDMAYRA